MKYLKFILKLAVSVAIITLVLRKIDERLLLRVLADAHWGWMLWTLLWFVLSKVLAGFRFNVLLKTEEIQLSEKQNLRLYWLGMYYNLLLPGGISGDGYKIKILMDAFQRPFKRLFTITLLDRLTGAVALGQLCLFLLLLPGIPEAQTYWWLWVLGIIISIPVTWALYRWAGGGLPAVWIRTSLQSLGVQAAQTIATLGLIFAFGQGEHWLGYSVLFLVSSVVAMLPLTIGGAGARELTFLWGAGFLGVDAEKAVAIAFLFYLISTAVSLLGVVYSFRSGGILKTDQA